MDESSLNFDAADTAPAQGAPAATPPVGSILDAPPPAPKQYHTGKSANPEAHPPKGLDRIAENFSAQNATLEVMNVKEVARGLTPHAMLVLEEIMMNPRAAAPARVAAVGMVLERGHGKIVNNFTPLKRKIAKLSSAEAYEVLFDAANDGELSHDEMKILVSALEARTKGLELETLAARLAELEAMLEIKTASSPNSRDAKPTMN